MAHVASLLSHREHSSRGADIGHAAPRFDLGQRSSIEVRMFRPFLTVLAVLAISAGTAHAQSSPLGVLDPCRSAGDALPDLEKRKQRLERDVGGLVKKLNEIKDAAKGDARVAALQKTMRTSREALLDVAFRIECARAKAAPPLETMVK